MDSNLDDIQQLDSAILKINLDEYKANNEITLEIIQVLMKLSTLLYKKYMNVLETQFIQLIKNLNNNNLNPYRLIYLFSKIMKIQFERITSQIRDKYEEFKKQTLNDPNLNCVDLKNEFNYEIFEEFINKVKESINRENEKAFRAIEDYYKNNQNTRKIQLNSNSDDDEAIDSANEDFRYTEFMSDTEYEVAKSKNDAKKTVKSHKKYSNSDTKLNYLLKVYGGDLELAATPTDFYKDDLDKVKCAHDDDDDDESSDDVQIIAVKETDNKTNAKSSRNLPVKLGMHVFALKDIKRYLWYPAVIARILQESRNADRITYCVRFVKNLNLNLKKSESSLSNDSRQTQSVYNTRGRTRQTTFRNSDDSDFDSDDDDDNSNDAGANDDGTGGSCEYDDEYDETVKVASDQIAFSVPADDRFILPIKSRVVSLYQNENDEKAPFFSAATIVEMPSERNKFRYLVMFDNGYAQYIQKHEAFQIFDPLTQPTNNLHPDHVKFLEQYFESYPRKPMLRFPDGSKIHVFFSNDWRLARVVETDASLVRIHFQDNKHYEWIYRGSYRFLAFFENMKKEENKQRQQQQQNGDRPVHHTNVARQHFGINYNNQDDQSTNERFMSANASTLYPVKRKQTARKQTCSKLNGAKQSSSSSSISSLMPNHQRVQQGQCKEVDLKGLIREEMIPFQPHPCTQSCIKKWEEKEINLKLINPLLVPIIFGWQRHISTQSKECYSRYRRSVNYVAPCGRRLRSISEVDRYLYLTNSMLTIDMFSFDCFVHTNREYEANTRYLKIDDITDGKEDVPISCVNCVDFEKPALIEYSKDRIPLEGVPLDTDINKMEGCDCKDGCRDRMKCSCWRKTIEATTFSNKQQMNTNVGYKGRRLTEMVSTGIFECNGKCKCDHRCGNRVVQNGISVRLQLFKTYNKGWGLRCLDDIAKGAFICIYTGHLLTEEQSDIRGQELGDEYFAELDFIECLKRLKGDNDSNKADDDNDDDFNNDILQCKVDYMGINDANGDYDNDIDEIDLEFVPKSVFSTQNKIKSIQQHNQIHLQQQSSSSSSSLAAVNNNEDIEYIYLNSDDENKDENDEVYNSYNNNNNSKNSKKRRQDNGNNTRNNNDLNESIDILNVNRFFTNTNNSFYYKEYLKTSSVYIMDAKLCGNIGRYFNHSCSPNIFVQNVFVDTYDLRFPWIAFFSSQFIRAGTELCWDYNYTIDSVKGRKLYCHCGSNQCRGRLL